MKLSFISIAVLFIISFTNMNAQQEYFEYGFKGGINLSNITEDVPSSYETRTSMNIGAYGLYKILPKLGIQAELLYSEQGFSNDRIPDAADVEKIEEILRMQYINLPVLASHNVIENLWVEGGFQVGYLVNAESDRERIEINNLGSVKSTTINEGKTDNYERIDVGLAGGLRYKLNRNFMIQARYTNSINDINKIETGDQYNSIFSFSVGYVF
ncbi:porin family protein [Psychroflexus salinarum]|uniref:Porin family protein n=1 Tax=Psychroflexus salinarum TaxID=546024 RepID=A0ABW3GLR1_9FLAO